VRPIGFAVVAGILACGAAARAEGDDGKLPPGEEGAPPGSDAGNPDDEPATAEAPPAVPDASWRAVLGRRFVLVLSDGRQLAGELIGLEALTVTVAESNSGRVASVAKAEVVELRLAAPLAPPPQPGDHPPEERERRFGLHLGALPLIAALDVQRGRFYWFLSASILFPILSGGDLDTGATGAGMSFRLPRSRWRIDVLAAMMLEWNAHSGVYYAPQELDMGMGLIVGGRYSWRNGIELALRVPVIGFAVPITPQPRSDGDAVVAYYLQSIYSTPVCTFGYRF
jgi:hypothetical protein